MAIENNFILIVAIVFVNSLDIKTGNKEVYIDRFNGVCSSETLIIINSSFEKVGNRLYINGTITVKENINSPPLFIMQILKCKSKNDFASCSEFYSFSTKQYCKLILSDSSMWGPYFKNIKPQWKCPMRKGIYTTSNSSFDLTTFLLLPDDGHFWKVRGEMFDGQTGKKIMCIVVDAHVEKKKS